MKNEKLARPAKAHTDLDGFSTAVKLLRHPSPNSFLFGLFH
ncbi:hypothetical protein [Paracidovorax anthurii]|nr:hypothetical protein [Paracidovorax anthurii]